MTTTSETSLETRPTRTQSLQPRIPVNWWGLLLRFVAAVIILLISVFATQPFVALAEAALGRSVASAYLMSAAMVVTTIVSILLVGTWLRVIERRRLRDITLFDGKTALTGFGGGFVLVGIAMVLSWLVAAQLGLGIEVDVLSEFAPAGEAVTAASVGATLSIVVAQAILLQGFPEELIFRGWLMDVTRNRPWLSFWWTTAAFTVIHLMSNGGQESLAERFVYLVMPLGMAVIAAALVLATGSFWWGVGTHGGMHLWSAILMVTYPVDQGPTLWILMGVTQMIIAAVILYRWRSHVRA